MFDFVQGVVSTIPCTRVLEVGSLNVNGSIRECFSCEYVGVDIQSGPGVDLIMNAHNLEFPDGSFDFVISTEMLEHDSAFWLSVKEMGRVLAQGGYLLLTARGNGFEKHEFPTDFWRFMPESFHLLFRLAGCEVVQIKEDPSSPGVFGLGRKL